MASVKLTNVKKVYDNNVVAVHDFNLDIADKEFIVFVGPSGCGKSTTLRMIAGLEDISGGTVEIDGVVVNDLQPRDRDIAMVFQNYALYPHLTVFENMAFPLRLKKMPQDEVYQRVTNAAEILGITEYLLRKPRALSGGQRQRVAIGRAMVRDSKVFLMDEPLSNLDAKLRTQMRAELTKLHQRLGSTFLYVTHDQTEAMTMGDRIVIMKDGVIQQVGTPQEVFDHPANLFVASFIGLPPMNFLDVTVKDGKLINEQFAMNMTEEEKKLLKAYEGKQIVLGVRPENTEVGTDFQLKVTTNENLGMNTLVHGHLGADGKGQRITCKLAGWCDYKPDDVVGISITKKHFFDKETTKAIRMEA